MGLNLSNGGDYTPHIRYMASTQTWRMSSENGVVDFQFSQCIADLANIKTGYGLFVEGQAPEWVVDPSLEQMALKPQDGREWKRGFILNFYSKNLFGNDPVRELATTATGVNMGIEALYNAFEAQKDQYPNQVPVIEFKGATPTRVGKGNTTVPNFEIVKFVDRPAELLTEVANEPVRGTPVQQAVSSGASEF